MRLKQRRAWVTHKANMFDWTQKVSSPLRTATRPALEFFCCSRCTLKETAYRKLRCYTYLGHQAFARAHSRARPALPLFLARGTPVMLF